jgi:hypothetical protein
MGRWGACSSRDSLRSMLAPASHTALTWMLRSLARLEAPGGLRPPRLTEPGFEKWHRIRRRLGWRAFLRILLLDVAETFPVPFNLNGWSTSPLRGITEAEAEALIREASVPDGSDPHSFLRSAAKALGLPAAGALSEVPRTQPHQRVMELAGTGGRIAAWQALHHGGVAFHDQFVFVADTDEERLLVGLSAAECRANPPTVLRGAEARALLQRGQHFDRFLGFKAPAAEAFVDELGLEARWV